MATVPLATTTHERPPFTAHWASWPHWVREKECGTRPKKLTPVVAESDSAMVDNAPSAAGPSMPTDASQLESLPGLYDEQLNKGSSLSSDVHFYQMVHSTQYAITRRRLQAIHMPKFHQKFAHPDHVAVDEFGSVPRERSPILPPPASMLLPINTELSNAWKNAAFPHIMA